MAADLYIWTQIDNSGNNIKSVFNRICYENFIEIWIDEQFEMSTIFFIQGDQFSVCSRAYVFVCVGVLEGGYHFA